jgi:cadmium resistance protein CadD (predicted permease)
LVRLWLIEATGVSSVHPALGSTRGCGGCGGHIGFILVDRIAATVAAAAVMFAATNIDDAVVLTVFNAASRATGAPKQWQIWAGQYLGIGSMVAVSLLAALGFSFVPLRWVGLLGLIPLTRGIAMLITNLRAIRHNQPTPPRPGSGLWSVAGVTFANGGDNIAIYTSAFRVMAPAHIALTVVVFAIGTALWCLAGRLLVSHDRLADALQRFADWIIPAVFILLGLYIFHRTGLLGLFG